MQQLIPIIIRFINYLIEKFFGKVQTGIDKSKKPKVFKEKDIVKYFNQRNLKKLKHVSCFATSISMALYTRESRLKNPNKKIMTEDLPDKIVEDLIKNNSEYIYKLKKLAPGLSRKFKPRNVFKFWQWYIKYKFNYDSTIINGIDNIKTEIKNKNLVCAGTNLTSGGHVVLLYGYSGKKNSWVCNDPYGVFPYNKEKLSGGGIFYKEKKYMGRNLLTGYGLSL